MSKIYQLKIPLAAVASIENVHDIYRLRAIRLMSDSGTSHGKAPGGEGPKDGGMKPLW